MEKVSVGITGCGNISDIYFRNLTNLFPFLEITGCCDLEPEKAEGKRRCYGVPVYSTVELMNREDVDIILNLTTPPVHGTIDKMALNHGKHVYSEKPFALDRKEASEVTALAEEKGLRVGCAPDTFLGAAFQTCRSIIDRGEIGTPLSVFASMNCPGHESWHPAPDFYYKKGGGPMLDMGPYYLTVLVSLLGPVKTVRALTSAGFDERICTAKGTAGRKVRVETPTHYQGLLELENGVSGTCVMSFDTLKSDMPRLEIHGTEGSLLIPDPNGFGGRVRLFRRGNRIPRTVSYRAYPYRMNSRGVGLADMADAIRSGRPHRASAEMAVHVLDVMLAFEEAGRTGAAAAVETGMGRPAAFPAGLKKGEV